MPCGKDIRHSPAAERWLGWLMVLGPHPLTTHDTARTAI